jgi:hypothetical protein
MARKGILMVLRTNITYEDIQELKKMLHYDPETGIFRQLKKWSRCNIGDIAGKIYRTGYVRMSVCFNGKRKTLLAHRIALAFINDRWPKEIDHINGIKHDNRLQNLREVERSLNICRRKWPKRKLPVGVYIDNRIKKKKYRAEFGGKYIGFFLTPEEAHLAYANAYHDKTGEYPLGVI